MFESLTPWTLAHQAPLSMGFPTKGYWSGLSFPSPGDLPDPGIKPVSPALQADICVCVCTYIYTHTQRTYESEIVFGSFK